MASQPLAVKLRCTSWGQVAALHERDLKRGKLFLRTPTAISLGREVRLDIVLPSGTVAAIEGRVAHVIPPGERGPGVELVLTKVPPSTLYLIESALEAAARPSPDDAALADEPQTAAAEADLLVALEDELRGLRGMNPFQILAVPYDADDEAVRKAFVELTRKYHPDRYARFESERGRALASEIFVTVRDAYRRIGEPAGRALVRSQIGRGQTRRDATPIFGVEVARAVTPVQGVPLSRAATPVQGLPMKGSAQPTAPRAPRPGTPVQGVPRGPSRRDLRAADPRLERDPAAPVAPVEPERTGPPSTAPQRPGGVRPTQSTAAVRESRMRNPPAGAAPSASPQGVSRPQPVVTFNRPEGASGLSAEELFGDLDELPRTSVAAAPVKLDVQGATKAAAELVDFGRYEEAMAKYDELLRVNPTDRSARAGRELAFGLKLAGAGDRVGAAQHLEAALEIEPWSERTARELNNIRRAVTDNRKGLLSKLLGKVT